MDFKGNVNKNKDKLTGYNTDYKITLKNMAVKMTKSVPVKVMGVVLFGSMLFVSSNQISSSAAPQNSAKPDKVKEWGITAGVASEIDRADGVLNRDISELIAISNNVTVATAVAEIPEETAKTIQELLPNYSNIGVANVDNYLNIRQEASEDGSLCGKLPKNAGCEILEDSNGWFKIKSGGVTGYVKSEYLLTGDDAWNKADEVKTMTATVDTETLYVREAMNTDCKIVALVSGEEELEVLEQNDNWAKVQVDSDQGYVSLDYVRLGYELPKAESVTELKASNAVSSTRVSIVEYAKQFLGNPYVWGGTSLTKGADCSGFTMSIYAHYGVSLPHSSAAQSQMGTKVSSSEVRPGDLLFYGSGKHVNHVAMYIGGGKVIHASTEKTGIKISNAFYRTPITIRRFLD